MNKTYPVLSEKEKEAIGNLDGNTQRGRHFGQLQCKKYVGGNADIRDLNKLKAETKSKYIGSIRVSRGEEGIWYFDGIDGKTYKVFEPADGIDELFEIEFKRRDV